MISKACINKSKNITIKSKKKNTHKCKEKKNSKMGKNTKLLNINANASYREAW